MTERQQKTIENLRETVGRLREDNSGLYALNGRMGYVLTGIANGLRGDPGPLTLRDWSGLPADVAEVRQMVVECLAEVNAVDSDIAVITAAYRSCVRKLALLLELK